MKTRMYREAIRTWNPSVGCRHRCVYCVPSFQRQAKRQKWRCIKCYNYEPHFHPERLIQSLPRTGEGEFIFACDMGDIAFASWRQREQIFRRVGELSDRNFLIQSKDPACFLEHDEYPNNLILGTTIETNRLELCKKVSRAPPPIDRYRAMLALKHPRKAVTHEPIMDFDPEVLIEWDKQIKPEAIWVGYDNHGCGLIEPPPWKFDFLIKQLVSLGFKVIKKRTKPIK